ncbi:helix-turn-helix domain-containing protein [Georgenia sp. Z1491]|uniref:helix-turn-helix domain-containing protein n=1 Tax=Georgenia sp. Z1491 TaxID=3416707 RepID=UPI003CFA634B
MTDSSSAGDDEATTHAEPGDDVGRPAWRSGVTGQRDRTPPGVPEPLWRHMVGDRLRVARHERGERLTDVAERAGLSPQYLSEVERGRKEPSSEMIAAIGGALDLTLVDLALSVAQRLGATPAALPHAGSTRDGATCRGAFALAA